MEANFQQYKEQAINTMTQGELLLLVYDELVKHLTRAGIALDKEQYELLEASVQKSVDIIHYLDKTLDWKYPISQNLHQLYEYFCYELSRVRFGRNKTELERVKGMIQELRATFREVEKSNDSGK